jgi:hypothetical protein
MGLEIPNGHLTCDHIRHAAPSFATTLAATGVKLSADGPQHQPQAAFLHLDLGKQIVLESQPLAL